MKFLSRLLLGVVVLVLVVVVLFSLRPFWLARQATHFSLFLSRVQSNYVLTPSGRVHYYEAESRIPGGGIPLVLVHGLADRDESWAPMLKRLKKAGFHVYAPDLMGFGRSPKSPAGDYSIEAQSKFVVDFVQALGLQRTDLGGWSMGGWIAMQVALDHPEMVDRLVVYNTAGLLMAAPRPGLFHPENEQELNALVQTLEPDMKPMPGFVARDFLRQSKGVQEATDSSMRSMLTGKALVDDHIGGLQMPLLIVWGVTDRLFPVGMAEHLHTLVPRSELDLVEGCGHLAPLVCSGRVAAATADFLKSNPAPTGGVRTLAQMH